MSSDWLAKQVSAADKDDADMVDVTAVPSEAEAMVSVGEVRVKPSKAVVEEAVEMPTHAKLAHVLAIVVSGVIAVCVACVLADGTSVIKLKDPQYLPVATNPALKSKGLNHRLDVLLGPTYGVGLHHDQSGSSWYEMMAGSTLQNLLDNLGEDVVIAALPSVISTDDLKHPVPFLSCDALQMAGICAMTFGFIAELVAVIMLVWHVLSLAGLMPAKAGKILGSLIWLVLTIGFGIVILLAVGVYSANWTCHQNFIPFITLSDHFDYNYGFYFAIAGFVSSLLIFLVTCTMTSTQDGVVAQKAPNMCMSATVVLCGMFLGIFITSFAAMYVAAANGAHVGEVVDPDVNPCEGKKPYHAGPGDSYFSNVDCMRDTVTQVLEQAGANVTKGYRGGLDAGDRVPITVPYSEAGLCAVNVHWHLGAEHLSVGQFDEYGTGPVDNVTTDYGAERRQLAAKGGSGYAEIRQGFQCRHFKADDPKFTTPFNWSHCDSTMEVGQTYEIHWPHSAAGACGTDWQYQSPFYDGVFCNDGVITIAPLNTYEKIGVEGQVFTIVNDEAYYHDNLIDGALKDASADMWTDVAMYTGSTTGTSRNNLVCSRYTPITWQVDRKCHMVSASTFDKLCYDMKQKKDNMASDLHAHGARKLVSHQYAANNQQSRKQ